ncbi:Fic family protein [Pseudonocardia sp. H11422]|uniref:Fic family protein n=1 Tax=Pseudonocardia sp. H11422 TaxID=2835866 RepID=UPI00397730D1
MERSRFVDELADLFADVNALHPFREGNGRTQRAFLTQLSADVGWRLRWMAMDPDENVRASQHAHRGDSAPLRAMLERLVVHPGRSLPAPRPPDE